MPFNGSGIFNRIYSWVTDAANGLPISSSRMDTDTNDIADGLTNCITRDGQSPAEADIPMGGFKITGLDDGVADDDAATVGQIETIANSPWIDEPNGTLFVNTTTFKVLGRDATETYLVGMAVRGQVTGGDFLGWVQSAVYSAPDTTVVLAVVPVLDAGLTNVQYSLIPPQLGPQPRVTIIEAGTNTNMTVDGSGTPKKVVLNLKEIDVLDEFDSVTNYRFTAKMPGVYLVCFTLAYLQTAAGATPYDIYVAVSGVPSGVLHRSENTGLAYGSASFRSFNFSGFTFLSAGQYLELFVTQFRAGEVGASFCVYRILTTE